TLRDLREKGYVVSLFFLWLPTVEIAIRRVKDRVKSGGHSVEDADVRRRFSRGLDNFRLYKYVVDHWHIIDGSVTPPSSVAYGSLDIWTCRSRELENALTKMVGD